MKRRLRREKNPPPESSPGPAGTAVRTNTRSPQTIGEAWPYPGISIFQRTFSVSLQLDGGSPAGAAPVASGPRHWGQSAEADAGGASDCAAAGATEPTRKAAASTATSKRNGKFFIAICVSLTGR